MLGENIIGMKLLQTYFTPFFTCKDVYLAFIFPSVELASYGQNTTVCD